MFKPKVYRSNGTEAYRLINDEGGNFLYEGKVDYSDAELFKDEQGRAYYLVTTEIGGSSKYYVEVEPEGKPIPAVYKDKAISDLVKTTPEEKVVEAIEPAPAPANEPEPVPEPVKEPLPVETPAPEALKETCFETPEKPMEETKPEEPGEKLTTEQEAQAAVKALASLGEHKPRKKSRLPLIITLIIVILIVAGAGIAVYRPGLISGLNLPFIWQTTPTPEPTVMPTPVPTAEPTATPTPTPTALPGGGDIYYNLLMIAPAINASDPAVTGFVVNNTNQTGTSYGNLSKVCDLFDAVNKNWSETNGNGTPQSLSLSVETMKGSRMDYSVLMASLVEAQGMDARIVAVYNDATNTYIYYPEVKAAANDMDYYDVKAYLRGRYDIQDPYGQTSGIDHWLSLSPGKTPGVKVDSKYSYAVNSNSEITPV
ncbi:MAG TPA: hypothetical protein VMC84_07515 [Methanocella sp.]|uniref:hypothetical protein n=1 Tax=Methanocella sp. TaxID=2052833 RepID=UPI002BF91883|nr:hypothetical protein [Methanocella sp.]HTY91007.1 hypothetical protein [Methanocella sp.]